jgi:hypothetical protein
VFYAERLRDAVKLLGMLHNEFTQLTAKHAVVPDPEIEKTMDTFARLYIETRISFPVPIDDDEQP